MNGTSTTRRNCLGVLSFALALLFLVFIAQASLHAHQNGQDDPACGLCQVAHIGIALAVSAVLLTLFVIYFDEIAAPAVPRLAEPFSALSSSRAPPALLA